MTYSLKIGPAQGLKLKGQAGFALPMIGGTGIKATKAGGIWTVDLDYSELTPGPVSDSTTAMVAILDQTSGIYREVSLSSLLTSGLDADLQAIAALTGAGILARTANNTWALRVVTGTANEITITNGDGVSGSPTASLPTALTFTGKTVTGGTFSGQTFVAPALGTPASGVATNLTGTASSLTAGHVTTNANLTGDVTSVGNAATIAANAVTNAKLATAADSSIKSNISGGTAVPSDNTITAVLDKQFGTTQGSVVYRGASAWAALTPGTSGNFLKTQGAAANPVWSAVPGGGDMLSTNNLSDLTSAPTALTNLGGTTTGKALFTATDAPTARATLGYKWEPIAQDTVSSVASWSAINLSAYRVLRLTFKLRSAVNDAFINFRTSSNNGSTYDSGASDYLTSNLIGNATTATSGGSSEAAFTMSGSGATSPLAASHIITLHDFNQAEYCFMQSQGFAISSANVKTVEMRGAARAQATARNAIQITLSSGNIATGILTLEGIKG